MKRDLKKLEKAYGSIFKVDIAGKSLDKKYDFLLNMKHKKRKVPENDSSSSL